MNCDKYRDLLSRYVDSEVTPRQRRELLAHVEKCAHCAAWLARVRQSEVLLKGLPQTQPSDRVRDAVLGSLRQKTGPLATGSVQPSRPATVPRVRGLHFPMLSLFLRFDFSPRRVVLGAVAVLFAAVGLAYWLNLLPPLAGYNKVGFELPPEANRETVDSTPVSAISQGVYGVGGPVAVPNVVRALPLDAARDVPLNQEINVRFDQPMDRASVEGALMVDPPAAGAFRWEADNEVRFSPVEAGLLRGITYTVMLSSTARSLAGTPLGNPAMWSFQTRAPYTVTPDLPSGASISPTTTFALNFQVPMDKAVAGKISVRGAGASHDIPISLAWDDAGTRLTVSPSAPLPLGEAYVRVAGSARTLAGDTLGRAYEFAYMVELPTPRLRLLDGRVAISSQPVSVRYEAIAGSTGATLDGVRFDLYTFPSERLSALGAQSRAWPAPLPPGVMEGLARVEVPAPTLLAVGVAEIGSLPAGIYLLVASVPYQSEVLADWQLLLVEDGSLALTGDGAAFWATSSVGKAWEGAEISLYSPEGALLEKGFADHTGLWMPSPPGSGASLAVARDGSGHLAALRLDPVGKWDDAPSGSLAVTMQTDLPAYRPGQPVNFRALLRQSRDTAVSTPVAEQQVSVFLIMPAGPVLSALTLKPDGAGGVSGLFNLSPDLKPGVYTLRVRAGNTGRDFPLHVVAAPNDVLSVYIAPGDSIEPGSATVTRTVSVLRASGEPAAGAALTATLGIEGDAWLSQPIRLAAGKDGRATIVAPLPAWLANYNEPALYLRVEAALLGQEGSDKQYLDAMSVRAAQAGVRQLVSPPLDVAVVASPQADRTTKVRIVSLGEVPLAGDLLALAESPAGERLAWVLDLAEKRDVTLELPPRFGGGHMQFLRAGVRASRMLDLMPNQDPTLSLNVDVPENVASGSQIPVRLGFAGEMDGAGMLYGTASVWLRRVSYPDGNEDAYLSWESGVKIDSSVPATATLTAPGPGLWYVMAEVGTDDGIYMQSWSVVRVMPGPSIQAPSMQKAPSGVTQNVSIIVHNPGEEPISSGVRAVGSGSLRVLGGGSQPVEVAAGGWQRLNWSYVAASPQQAQIEFQFMPSSGVEGAWTLDVQAEVNPRTVVTYASGVFVGERLVGVQVPSGLSSDRVELEIRASTSLLPALANIASGLPVGQVGQGDGADWAATRLSGASSVAAAYNRAGYGPAAIELSSVERSLALQQIYAAQHADGGWGVEGSDVESTAHVLLALRRQQISWTGAGGEAIPPADVEVISRGLAYLAYEVGRPLTDRETQALMDERAYGLYALASYGQADAEWARALMAYAGSGSGQVTLSRAGQAWLALALMQSGSTQDAFALVDRLLQARPASADTDVALEPLLELLVASGSTSRVGAGATNKATYEAGAASYARSLMEARRGTGWSSPAATAGALWALSLYAKATGEKPVRGSPSVTLHDRPVQAAVLPDDPGTISVVLPGDALQAGNNWLKLKAPAPDQSLYYSLTLRVTR
ncbi:MAG TPA: Ig-like domain-containing protein [Chloroflexia bacterium]|nr:Ig-like domain-containing protein [Chloroflexia bacterium]